MNSKKKIKRKNKLKEYEVVFQNSLFVATVEAKSKKEAIELAKNEAYMAGILHYDYVEVT